MRTFHALCLLFVLIYTRGAINRFGLPDFATKFVVELSVLFLIYPVLKRSRWNLAPGWIFVVLFIMLTVLSGIVSGDGLYLSLLYFRMFAYAYLVFWAVWNADLTRREVLRLNRLILWLWILQLAAALFELFVLGERKEYNVGTMVSGGGGSATAFPLFTMAYVMAFYCYYRRSAWVVLLALSFGVVGYASGKRGIYFLIPIFYALIILWYCLREKSFASFGRMIKPVLAFALLFPVFMFGLTHSKRFTSSQGAGTIETIRSTIGSLDEYTFRTHSGGATSGRTATSLKVLRNLSSGAFAEYFLGLGPGSMTNAGGKRAGEAEGIIYGVVGWAKDTISVGWLAMLFHVSFYALLWRKLYLRRSAMSNDYAKALHFGCHLGFAAYFLLYFVYLDAFAMAGWFTFVHFYLLALLLSPNHQHLHQDHEHPTHTPDVAAHATHSSTTPPPPAPSSTDSSTMPRSSLSRVKATGSETSREPTACKQPKRSYPYPTSQNSGLF